MFSLNWPVKSVAVMKWDLLDRAGTTSGARDDVFFFFFFFLWIYCIQRANSSIKERYKALKRKRAVVVDLGVNLLQKQNEMIEGMKIITGQ